MLELLEKLSIKLQPFRKLIYLLVAILIVIIVIQLLQTPSPHYQSNNSYAILSFITCIWLLLFNILISTFNNIPSLTNKSLGVVTRLKVKLWRFYYHFLALLFIGLTLVIVFLSIRLLRI